MAAPPMAACLRAGSPVFFHDVIVGVACASSRLLVHDLANAPPPQHSYETTCWRIRAPQLCSPECQAKSALHQVSKPTFRCVWVVLLACPYA